MDKMDNLINQTQTKYNYKMKMMKINLTMIKMKSSQIMWITIMKWSKWLQYFLLCLVEKKK